MFSEKTVNPSDVVPGIKEGIYENPANQIISESTDHWGDPFTITSTELVPTSESETTKAS